MEADCNKVFRYKGDLTRHFREAHSQSPKKFLCPVIGCHALFKRQYRLANHMLNPSKKAEGHPKAKGQLVATRLANSKDVICYTDAGGVEPEDWNTVEYKVPQKYTAVFE